jgi:hypothetical protein
LSVPDEGYSKKILSVPDEGYSRKILSVTWWRLFQKDFERHLMKVIPERFW